MSCSGVCVYVCVWARARTSQGCPVDLSPKSPVALPGPQGIPVFLVRSEGIGLAKDRTSLLLCFSGVVQLPPLHSPCGPGVPPPWIT